MESQSSRWLSTPSARRSLDWSVSTQGGGRRLNAHRLNSSVPQSPAKRFTHGAGPILGLWLFPLASSFVQCRRWYGDTSQCNKESIFASFHSLSLLHCRGQPGRGSNSL